MSSSLFVTPDIERAAKDLLKELMEDFGEDVTVGVGVPRDWTVDSPAHLQVSWDGTPTQARPVIARGIIRIIARAASTSEAKRLAALAEGLLIANREGSGITSIRSLASVLPARDPDTEAELASVSLRATMRLTVAESGS